MNKSAQEQRDLLQGFRQIDATLAALGELLAALSHAYQQLEADRRRGWVSALDALLKFLSTLDRDDANCTRVPIATLSAALQDLDLGKVDPGLRPQDIHGRRPVDGYDSVVIRCVAAAAMDLLMKLGRTKRDAARAVARSLDQLGVRIGNSRNARVEDAGKTVEKWRERLEEGSDQQRAIERYKSIKEILRFPPLTSADEIEAGLSKLLSMALAGRIKKSRDPN